MTSNIISKDNVNLLNDHLFKALFRSVETRDLVASFLSKITNIDFDQLKNADFQGGEISKKNIHEKAKVSDIIIKLEDHNRIIIEMNQFKSNHIFEKNTSYAFSLYSELIPIHSKHYPKIFLINIDNFNHFKTDKGILSFKLRDEDGHIETDKYESIHLIIENIIKAEYNGDKDIKKTIQLLKETNIDDMKKKYKGDAKYMAAVRRVEDLSTDPNFIGYYDKEEAIQQDLDDMWETGYDEGIKEIINKMVANGFDDTMITKITGISLEELQKMKEDK